MLAKAMGYEKFLKALGAGVFGRVEYESETKVMLRIATLKTADLSGTVRMYFNNKREQVMSGRRFDPMGSGLLLLRPGMFYRVYTTLEIAQPLPSGVSALVVLNEDAADVMVVATAPFQEGYTGPVAFTIQPFRKIEVEKMTSFASLMFFEDASAAWVKGIVKPMLKKANSDRARKSTRSTGAKKTTEKKVKEKEGALDADILSNEHSDNPES